MSKLSVFLRVVISIGLIVFMFSRLDFRNMIYFVGKADLFLVGLTLVAVLADRALMILRWVKLVDALDVFVSRLRIVKIFFLSTFFGSFLPSGVGGESVRAASFSRLTDRTAESIASVVMDRLLGLLSMLLMALLSMILFYGMYPHPALFGVVLLVSILVVLGMALILSRDVQVRLLESKKENWFYRIARAIGRYRDRFNTLVIVLILSLGVQLLRVLQAYLLSEAMSLDTAAIYFLCFIPPILIITMLPISIGGWGTTNAAYVAFFSTVGMDSDGAFALSILILALGVLGNLPGGLIYALEGFRSTDGSQANTRSI